MHSASFPKRRSPGGSWGFGLTPPHKCSTPEPGGASGAGRSIGALHSLPSSALKGLPVARAGTGFERWFQVTR